MTSIMMNSGNDITKTNENNKMVIRTKDGISTICDVVVSSDTCNDSVRLVPSTKVSHTTFACCSPNGLHVFFQTLDKGIVRYSTTMKDITAQDDGSTFLKDSKAIQYLAFSPLGR